MRVNYSFLILALAAAIFSACNLQASKPRDQRVPLMIEPSKAVSSPAVATNNSDRTSGRENANDFTAHVDQLKKRLPSKDFSIIVERPFVVIGDEPHAVVKQRAEGTVRWAVERLKQDYFTDDPEYILDIWLFKDDQSYNKHAQLLFGDTPTTPYGYYASRHKALIMNISTGGGTLVHEIVHPFVEANFPECPAWLNEGLGSLYEQCGEEDGHIHGYTNWRLPALQQAIRSGQLPTFKTLTATTVDEFYNSDRGTNYAQARYLCYYLQQKGLLVKFYKEFYANRKSDPTGYLSLQKVLGERDMDAFQERWEEFVLGLRVGYEVSIQ